MEAQGLNPQATLLHQAQTSQQQQVDLNPQHPNYPTPSLAVHQDRTVDPRRNNHPQAIPTAQLGYLNPMGERRSRDPSPANGRLEVPSHMYTHTRSRSDPAPFVRDSTPVFVGSNRYEYASDRNFVRPNQEHSTPSAPRGQDDAEQPITFPKWNPFSSEFVVNTETTDEDFANLRKPTYTAAQQAPQQRAGQHVQQTPNQTFHSQYVSGNVPPNYAQHTIAQQAVNVSGTPSSNSSPYSSKSSSRRSSASDEEAILAKPLGGEITSTMRGPRGLENNAYLEASVNTACDVGEMTARFDRGTTLMGGAAGQHGMPADVFDAVPFRKPTQRTVNVETQEVDPFGAVPFRQKEAAKLARRQAKRSNRNDRGKASGETSKRNLPIVPTQVRK